MAVIDIGMSMEEVMAGGEMEEPADGDYRFRFEGLLKKDGNAIFATKKGGKKVLAKLLVVSPDPALASKGIIYTGVVGAFSLSNLARVIPGLMGPQGLDDEAGVGTEFMMTVGTRTYKDEEGNDQEGRKFSKMREAA
jgi:hypothetical protein